jgi:hypothetical protein
MKDRTEVPPSPEGAEAFYPRSESHARLFRRFLHFGLLTRGGPVPQIAKFRQELVAGEHCQDRRTLCSHRRWRPGALFILVLN